MEKEWTAESNVLSLVFDYAIHSASSLLNVKIIQMLTPALLDNCEEPMG